MHFQRRGAVRQHFCSVGAPRRQALRRRFLARKLPPHAGKGSVLSALPAHNTLHRRVRMHAHVLRCASAARPLHLRGNAPPRAHIIMSPSKPAHIDSHAFTIAWARARLTAFGFDGVRAEAAALRLRTCARARVRLHATAVADAATAPTKPMPNSARAPAHAKRCEHCVLFNADCVIADVTAC